MKVVVNGVERNLPDFLVVGAGKSGTTSLYEYLINHPEIFLPKEVKETLFFHIVNNPNKEQLKFSPNSVTDFEKYLSLFDNASKGLVCGEVCPSYLYYHKFTIENVKRFHPRWDEVKIVIILREPVSKVISQYYFLKYTLKIPEHSLATTLALEQKRLSLNNVLPDLFLVDTTRYYSQVKAYMDTFKHVKIYFYDDFKQDPKAIVKDLLGFLEVDKEFEPANIDQKYNVSTKPRVARNRFTTLLVHLYQTWLGGSLAKSTKLKSILLEMLFKKEVTEKDKKYLRNVFRTEVDKLKKLLNNDLRFWEN